MSVETPTKRTSLHLSVTFNDEVEIVGTSVEPCEEAMWWNREEMARSRQASRELSAKIRDTNDTKQQTSCGLTCAYKKTSLMLQNDLEALVRLSPTTPEQDLFRWCCKMDGRRGLERYASRYYAANRHEDIAESRRAVFQEQQRQRDEEQRWQDGDQQPAETAGFGLDMDGLEQKQCLIAKVARESSRRARSFALFMGEADYLISRAQQQVRDRKPSRRAAFRRSRGLSHESVSSRNSSSRSLKEGNSV